MAMYRPACSLTCRLGSPIAAAQRMERSYQPLIFGSIHDCSLDAIWQSPAYREFRRAHRARDLDEPCQSCLKTRVRS